MFILKKDLKFSYYETLFTYRAIDSLEEIFPVKIINKHFHVI